MQAETTETILGTDSLRIRTDKEAEVLARSTKSMRCSRAIKERRQDKKKSDRIGKKTREQLMI